MLGLTLDDARNFASNDLFGFALGLVRGMQYQVDVDSKCYTSTSQMIDAVEV